MYYFRFVVKPAWRNILIISDGARLAFYSFSNLFAGEGYPKGGYGAPVVCEPTIGSSTTKTGTARSMVVDENAKEHSRHEISK